MQIPGTEWTTNWQHTLSTLRALTTAGFMLNLRKCQFLQPKVVMVGMEIHRGEYRLAKKSLKNWVGTTLPKSLKEI